MSVSIRYNVLKKMDTAREDIDALARLAQTMIDDLIERRQVRDPELFKYCFEFVTGEDDRYPQVISQFSSLAAGAFNLYHDYRAEGATVGPDGQIVIPEAKDEWGLSYGDAHYD